MWRCGDHLPTSEYYGHIIKLKKITDFFMILDMGMSL